VRMGVDGFEVGLGFFFERELYGPSVWCVG